MAVCRAFAAAIHLAASLLIGMMVEAAPFGSAFHYQGRLQDQGQPANGSYDLQFRLFAEETLGEQRGSTSTSDR